ncbi:MAG: hypothetical protein HY717_10855 [Planctomycetes bacterium]|nr:hypothetical protein [Planctomycetota bacterium]
MLLILLVLNGLFLPLGCLPMLLAFNTVNPMALAFIVGFTVENQTAEK